MSKESLESKDSSVNNDVVDEKPVEQVKEDSEGQKQEVTENPLPEPETQLKTDTNQPKQEPEKEEEPITEQPEEKPENQEEPEIIKPEEQENIDDEIAREFAEDKENYNEEPEKPKPRKKKRQKKSFDLNGLNNYQLNEYNGLKDNFLQGFFCTDKRKHHLIKMGLITKDGYIVNNPEEYLRKKELYNKIYGAETKESKKRSKTQAKKTFNPYRENPVNRAKKTQAGPKKQLIK